MGKIECTLVNIGSSIINLIHNIDSSRSVNYRLRSRLPHVFHFGTVRPFRFCSCIFNFLRSPEFMQRYTRSVVHDERVCEKLSVIVERVCMMRRKLPHALLQFVFITGRYLVHENRLCSFRFARIFHSNFLNVVN